MNDTVGEEFCDTETGLSREEIVKRFDLPERKTKINTILKLREEPLQAVYCLCQSSDISKFMIGCEKCDEWYHGDCIGLEERDAKLIKKWYCFDCIEKHGLKVVYFPHDGKKSSHKRKKDKKHKRQDKDSSSKDGLSCGKCSNCLQNEECGNKDYSERVAKYPKYDENREVYTTPTETAEEQARKLYKEKKRRDKEERRRLAELDPKACIGPGCTNPCRVNSKYCSDDCGIAMAKNRILSILPNRIMQHQDYPSVAEQYDKTKLEDIRLRKRVAFEELQRLDVKEKKMLEMIGRAKKVSIVEAVEETEDDSKLYCVTCGWEVPSRSFIRHLEICFRKFETQTAVEGLTKSNSDYCNIFCDHYNSATKTFCMRLRYICPDHFKPRKAGDNEVCGCPLVNSCSTNIFSETGKFCQKPKKTCNVHYNWEILAISDIDLERQREWTKLSILIGQEAAIVKQMSNRLGALGLLLHSTEVNYASI